MRERRGCPEARGPVRALGEPAQLRELEQVGPVGTNASLAVLLGEVERAVRDPHELGALDAVLRVGGDAGRDRDLAGVLARGLGDPVDHRLRDREALVLVTPGKQERELVASEAEGLPSLAQAGSDLGEHPVSDRMAVAVVDLLEVVDVEQAHSEREPLGLGLVEIALYTERWYRAMATSGPTSAIARSGERSQRTASIRLTEAMIENGTAVQ